MTGLAEDHPLQVKAEPQSITVYSEESAGNTRLQQQQQNSVKLSDDYALNLKDMGFDDSISSFCVDGVYIINIYYTWRITVKYLEYSYMSILYLSYSWLLYAGPDYNKASGNSGTTMYTWGEGYCQDMDPGIDDMVSSIRFSGAPDGYKLSLIHI